LVDLSFLHYYKNDFQQPKLFLVEAVQSTVASKNNVNQDTSKTVFIEAAAIFRDSSQNRSCIVKFKSFERPQMEK
jgi:hypothetical protein